MNAKCSSCGAEIMWIALRPNPGKQKPHPVNMPPQKRIVLHGVSGLGTSDPLGSIMDTYESHFATCPNAEQHRKSK